MRETAPPFWMPTPWRFSKEKESHREMALFFALFWGIPPLRRRVPLLAAVKEPKRRFLEVPLWLAVSTGGQNLSGFRISFRATGPWRGGGRGVPVSLGPPGFCHAFGWPVDGGRILCAPTTERCDTCQSLKLVRGKRSFPQSSLPSFLSRKRRRGHGPRRRGRPGGSRRCSGPDSAGPPG